MLAKVKEFDPKSGLAKFENMESGKISTQMIIMQDDQFIVQMAKESGQAVNVKMVQKGSEWSVEKVTLAGSTLKAAKVLVDKDTQIIREVALKVAIDKLGNVDREEIREEAEYWEAWISREK